MPTGGSRADWPAPCSPAEVSPSVGPAIVLASHECRDTAAFPALALICQIFGYMFVSLRYARRYLRLFFNANFSWFSGLDSSVAYKELAPKAELLAVHLYIGVCIYRSILYYV